MQNIGSETVEYLAIGVSRELDRVYMEAPDRRAAAHEPSRLKAFAHVGRAIPFRSLLHRNKQQLAAGQPLVCRSSNHYRAAAAQAHGAHRLSLRVAQ